MNTVRRCVAGLTFEKQRLLVAGHDHQRQAGGSESADETAHTNAKLNTVRAKCAGQRMEKASTKCAVIFAEFFRLSNGLIPACEGGRKTRQRRRGTRIIRGAAIRTCQIAVLYYGTVARASSASVESVVANVPVCST
jgi:hypothetical protein